MFTRNTHERGGGIVFKKNVTYYCPNSKILSNIKILLTNTVIFCSRFVKIPGNCSTTKKIDLYSASNSTLITTLFLIIQKRVITIIDIFYST